MEAAENKKPAGKSASPDHSGERRDDAESTLVFGNRSLRRLRDRIERAAHELRVLREENTSLQERIAELEASSVESVSETNAFFFESDPESVKRTVEGFIQAIDRYLDDPDRT